MELSKVPIYSTNAKMKKLIISIFTIFICFGLYAQDIALPKGKALFGAMKARHIGPALMSGRVADLEGHPTNPKILYAGTAGGGVWRSTDGGVTFKSIFDDHCQSIGVVTVDPTDPDNTIWVGTGEIWTRNSVSVGDGLYRSTDAGKSWDKIGFEKSERISSIQINPNNPKEIYVGILGALWGDSEVRGVYKSTDSGQNWSKILYLNQQTGCSDLTMDPNDPNTLYAAFWEFRRTAYSFNSGGANSALFKSTDGGQNWNKIHNGFPSGKLGRIAIAIAPSAPNVLYSVIESEKKENKGLYRSDDGGASWTHQNKDFELAVRPFYFSRLVVHPTNAEKVAKAGLFGSISEDGGKTFRTIGSGVHPDIHDYWFGVEDEDRMYLGSDGGFYRSWDGGTIWEMVKGLPLSQFYHVTVDNAEPFNVYGGLQDNGSWVGLSASSGGIEPGDWTSVGFGDGFRVYPHPTKKGICYSEMQGAQFIWRVDMKKNQSKTIQPVALEGDPKYRFNWNPPITTSVHNPSRLYVGSQFLHMSDDEGDSWEKISPDLSTNDPSKQNQIKSGGISTDNSGAENHCTVFTISESPLHEKIIWAGTDDGNVQLTRDGGKNWTNLTTNFPGLPANTWCYHIEASNHSPTTAYAVFDGHTQNDGGTYVYKTSDYGKTWNSIINDDVVGFARSIQEDYVNPRLLFWGTEFGLYITVDGGNNWSKFTNNMPAAAVHHVTLHKRDHALVMATHGRGVIVIDDITPLRQLTKEVASKNVHFFEQEASIIKEPTSFGGTATFGEFVGSNPTNAAQIFYYLKKRHTFGKMFLKIYNSSGEMVADLPPGKSKGINIVNWNYRYKHPKIAKAKTFTFGGFNAPYMPQGEYTIKLTKGKEAYEHKLLLVPDPSSVHSDEDRAFQHEIAMKLYNMNEEMAYIIDQVEAISAKSENLKSNESSRITGKSKKLLAAIEKYKQPLVILTGDNYVDSADPQLRENIATLYGNVASYPGRPGEAKLQRLKFLSDQLADAQKGLKKIIKMKDDLNKALGKEGLEEIELRTKEEFLEADI